MNVNNYKIAIEYCKKYKLKLNDFNNEGYFIASKKTTTNVYKSNFSSKKEKIKCEYIEGFLIIKNDVITVKNYGKFYNCIKFILTYNTLKELKEIKNSIISKV